MRHPSLLLALLPIVLHAVACEDPCAVGAGASPWVQVGQKVSGAIGAATNPFYTPQTRAQQCAPSAPVSVPEDATDRSDGGACGVAAGDDACVACLKADCCAEVLACDTACLDAAADAGPYSDAVACGIDHCRAACGGAS